MPSLDHEDSDASTARRGFSRTRTFSHNLAFYDSNFGGRGPESKSKWRTWPWAAALAIAIAGLPSAKIARVTAAPPPSPMPVSLNAGLPFIISDPAHEIDGIEVEGRALSKLQGGRDYFGAAGLYDRDRIIARGVLRKHPTPIEKGLVGLIYSAPLQVFSAEIRVERGERADSAQLRLPASAMPVPNAESDERRALEARMVRGILGRDDGEIKVACWEAPLRSTIASEFGAPRAVASGEHYPHAGVDLKATFGSPLKAPGPGSVTMAEELAATGKMILLYHGGGLFTRYMRLSEIVSKPGDEVGSGQVLGFSGNGPASEGSNVHWEAIWKGKAINPIALLDLSRQLCAERAALSASAAHSRLNSEWVPILGAPPTAIFR